jgi:hypothetical protein
VRLNLYSHGYIPVGKASPEPREKSELTEEHTQEQEELSCPNCGAELPDEAANFCPGCGTELPEETARFCSNCGEELPKKPPTFARSAERSSKKTSRGRPTRNLHNRPMKKNHHVEKVVPKVLLVGLKGPLGVLAVLLVGLRGLPVNQAGHLEGAEHGEPRKAHKQQKREHRIDKMSRLGNKKGL